MKKIVLIFILIITANASTLNLSMTSSPSRLNPILSNDTASSQVSGWLFNGLFKYDKDGNIIPDIATSYKFETNTKLIINLRKDVLWHDNKKVTAHDVVFTYEKIIDPKVFNSIVSNFKEVKRVKALDDFTLEVIYKKPYFKALHIWMIGVLPKHLLEKEENLMTSSFNKQPVGNGPYKLESFKNSSDIILKANENYHEGKPKIDEISFKFLPNPDTVFLMLKENKLDVGALSPLQIDRQISPKFKEDFKIVESQSFSYDYLGFNLRNKKFQDKRVREALSLAINRQEMVDILFFGHGKVCNGPFLPGSFAFNEKIKQTKQDLKKAKQLLKEAGYDEKNPFSFEIVTNTGNEIRLNAALIIQYQLAKIGVNAKIKVMEWQAFLNTIVHPRKFETVLLGWSLALMPDAYPLWHSDSDKLGRFNLVGYRNSEVDELIEKGALTIDQEELSNIYKKLFKLISEDLPYLFLYIPNSITVVNSKIKNVEPSFIGVMHNQKDWIKP
ncbi:peptide-binding protein [Halarcobacter bivalviorum]|uniref:Extracellular solute-binding protein n=1 Tax=Halarcobacter bivalviorum TaxID=663364 RepID=A0AAX2A5X6_9BACT|nr:peptide-binding protein [Halarcobacter bivalviorum]AXH11211.1 extracellular solute-binding protein [Halarcobacter bivalviorum]RXK09483.1 peptide ABC transporter substrate-binding protein [Halarcobacter bivalviorum]